MPTSRRRERELARDHYERQQLRRSEQRRQSRKRSQILAAVVAVLLVVGGVVAVAALNGDDATVTADPGANPAATTQPAPEPGPESSPDTSEPPAAAGECAYTPTEGEEPAKPVEVPTYDEAVATQPYTATLTTNRGDIVFEAAAAEAPCTSFSFRHLVESSYFDDTPCHRLTTETDGIFVLQCGDPTGTGSGGPGYGFGIENAPADGMFPAGTVAMARSQDPNSNGSQFFIVYEDTMLPTDGGGYTIFGTVTEGLDIVQEVAAAGVDAEAPPAPAEPVTIETATLATTKAA